MKKFFTLCLALLAISSMPAMAQDNDEEEELDNTFQFVKRTINGTDTTWTVINDGETYNATEVEVDEWGSTMVLSGLYVHNTSEDDSPARVHLTIDSLPSGAIQFCMLGNCAMPRNVGVDNVKGGTIGAGANDDMMLEWLPDENSYGTATITLQANPATVTMGLFNNTYADIEGVRGPKITVHFVNPDPAGISNVNAKAASSEVAAIYNVRGEQLSSMQKGVNIVRYADGTTRKILK